MGPSPLADVRLAARQPRARTARVPPVLLALLLSLTALAFVDVAAAEGTAVCTTAVAPTELPLDTPVLGNDASAGTGAPDVATGDCFFAIAIPEGVSVVGKELAITITTTENHDLFVARGANVPKAAPYVCSSVATTATGDACRVYWPLTQPTYTVRVGRIAAGTSNFTITATLVAAPASGCSNGYAITPLTLGTAASVTVSGPAGSRCYFTFTTNPGDDVGKVLATGLPATLGSYVIAKPGDVPTPTTVPGTTNTGDYGCSPPLTGTSRTCAGAGLPGQAWYAVLIRGTAITTTPTPFGITASSLLSCSLGTGIHNLTLGTATTGSVDGSAAGFSCKFRLPIDQAESLSKWAVTSSGANVDLYLRASVPVATGVYDCGAAGTSITGTDVCALPAGGITEAYASVYRPAAGATLGSFSLVATAVEGCPGNDGLNAALTGVPLAVTLTDLPGASCRFRYEPDPDDTTVRITAAPTAGTQTLLVRRDAAPTSTVFDCSAAAAIGTPAVCDVENLGVPVFATLKRATGAGAANLTAIGLSPCSLGGGDTTLLDGVAADANLTADENGACRFKLDVAGAVGDGVAVEMTPAAGDFDLYVRKGARPSTSAYDCRSIVRGNATGESCLAIRDAGIYYAMVLRVDGSGAFTVKAKAIASCSLGTAASVLATGDTADGELVDADAAKCYFAITPGNPLADPLAPANDVLKLALDGDGVNNFDLYVRKGAVPTTTTRDCQSVLGIGATDACELLVPDGSTYYAMVRRTSGSGAFRLAASTSSSCSLGAGYHELPNGLEVSATTRQMTGARCYFSIGSGARDDLFSLTQSVAPAPGLTSFNVALAKDHAASVPPAACTGTSYHYSLGGIVLQQAAQCDLLLEDGLAHDWFASVTRTAGSAPDGAAFSVKAASILIPTLQPGVPQLGHVDTGTIQYWKVVLPENATFLDVQTAGDVSNLGCAIGTQANALVGTACLLLPFPKLVGCAVAAGYGVSCDDVELTLEERCVAETGDAEACAQAEAARLAACDAVNGIQAGTCVPEDTSGGLTDACGPANRLAGAGTCDPQSASVKTTELDLLVRHRFGLPTTATNDCRSANPGATERCLFSADAKELHDNVTEPAQAGLEEALGNVTAIVEGNRTAFDEAIAALSDAVAENRTTVVEPLWAAIREIVVGATGQDPGGLPATPAIPAVPAPSGVAVPDQTDAKPLPGPGKYFIAVRGPLDLLSSLYYKGGDYAIVALHDDLKAPTQQELKDQADAALAHLDDSLGELCERTGEPAACAGLGAIAPTLCDALNATGIPCLVPDLEDVSVGGVLDEACAPLAELGLPCPDRSIEGVCEDLPTTCGVVDGAVEQAAGNADQVLDVASEVLAIAAGAVADIQDGDGLDIGALVESLPEGSTGIQVHDGEAHVLVVGHDLQLV